jgi:hypothetical protein
MSEVMVKNLQLFFRIPHRRYGLSAHVQRRTAAQNAMDAMGHVRESSVMQSSVVNILMGGRMSSSIRKLLFLGASLPIVFAMSFASAATVDTISGQWTGNSQVDGDRFVSKTMLSLGSPDGENALLRIEGRNTCTLRQGTYSSDASGAWTLSFKDPMGGDACTRLAKGTFTLHPGSNTRQLDFEVKYPGSDGQEVLRRGALTRYP